MLKRLLVNRATIVRNSVSSSRDSLVSSWKGVMPGMVTTGQAVWETLD